ncbi:MAG TPA: oxygen-independent coproporphyrinogen III oxidase [Candidatus Saccharimonadales bacterium]|nr:oxygen-independent coproporphyrinogen III oxidase [Candidatus Saccharimonadales bacterium]
MSGTSSVRVTAERLARFDRPGPRYTSYPTAVEFNERFTADLYVDRLLQASELPDEPLSLYLHLPFCEERCYFCGCNVIITRKPEVSVRYLEGLHREVRLIAKLLGRRRKVNQYHWGGGTPTYLSPDQMARLHAVVAEEFEFTPDAEIAIEVDPRVTTGEQVELLRRLGWNRISMGVQDFDPTVQEAVNRVQPFETTRDLFRQCRDAGFGSINLDLIYGLPNQRPETFRHTVEQVVGLRPDRVACYSYAYVPWIKHNQKGINPEELPTREVKFELLATAIEGFLSSGYVQVGMDHFALETDELAVAMRAGRLYRNFMGYTVMPAADQVGLGVSSISDVRGAFAQNTKKLPAYYGAVDAGRPPVERGYALVGDDALRRDVIMQIMCNFRVDIPAVERRWGVDFESTFARELQALREGPGADGLVRVAPGVLECTEDGRLFVRLVAMHFDRYLKESTPDKPVYSRTV